VKEEPKPDWLDFLALVIAAYQLILPAVLAILALVFIVFLALKLLVG